MPARGIARRRCARSPRGPRSTWPPSTTTSAPSAACSRRSSRAGSSRSTRRGSSGSPRSVRPPGGKAAARRCAKSWRPSWRARSSTANRRRGSSSSSPSSGARPSTPTARCRRAFTGHMKPTFEAMLAALVETLPGVPREVLYWRLQFVIGAMARVQHLARQRGAADSPPGPRRPPGRPRAGADGVHRGRHPVPSGCAARTPDHRTHEERIVKKWLIGARRGARGRVAVTGGGRGPATRRRPPRSRSSPPRSSAGTSARRSPPPARSSPTSTSRSSARRAARSSSSPSTSATR